jgi:tricorn protease
MQKLNLVMLALLTSIIGMAQGTRLLREPTISQNKIVFVHANDLWIVDREGGDAQRLTASPGAESNPHFSPDGQLVAFTGQYDGNTDVYVVPVEGGAPRRLTYHPGGDYVQGWMPEGNEVVFRSSREGYPTRLNRFYKVSNLGGQPERLPIPRVAYGEISPDGNYAAYIPITYWDYEWRNYRGGQAMPVWILNLNSQELTRVPQPDQERHHDPVWMGNKVYFLSERDYASNIWSYDLATEAYEQVTFHQQFDCKSLDAGPDAIVYEQGGYLHLLNPENGESRQLEINVKADLNWARDRWVTVNSSRIQNAALSPTGQRAVFEYRGEIFTVPKENGTWRNISNHNYADRSPVWSPDGSKIAWFSDRNGEYQLMINDQFGTGAPTAIALPNPTFYFKPAWSPDGKYIAYTDTDYNLWMVNLESGESKKVDTDRYAHPNRTMNPVWSPDSKWIAYVKLTDAQFKVVKAYNIENEKILSISDEMADALTPAWDASGKYLYFLASTNWGLNTGWLDMSSYNQPVTRGLYLAVLDDETPSPLLPESDEEETDTKAEDSGEKEEKETDSRVTIVRSGLSERILSVDLPQRNYTFLVSGPENSVFVAENVPNQQGVTLHKYDLKEQEASEFMTGINAAISSHDRKQLLYRMGGSWGIVSTAGKSQKPGDGKLTMDARIKVDPQEEWQQIFREAWRYQRDFLYVDNVHGAPWDKIYQWYQPWVQHVKHREDMNYIIDILGGEVSVGHSYTGGGDYPDVDRIPVGLLGADYEKKNGRFQITIIYTGENWNPGLEAPLAGPGLNVKVGDYLLMVNGKPITAEMNLYSAFEFTAGKVTRIAVNDQPKMEGARYLNVIPVSSEYQLRSIDWIETNRRYVDEKTNGKIGYTYVPNTGGQGYTYFNRYYFSQQDKKGMIIDERNNGGGSAADYMVDIMNRKIYGYFNSKANDRKPWTTPMAGVWGPKVMLINERAGSGGDLLPYLFREMEIGPLIGTRTWGGLVGTWDTPPFIDNGRMVAPRGGFFDKDGNWAVEGEGVAPDLEVIQDPKQQLQGIDPQLEAAIEQAMQLLETEKIELKEEPPAPVKWKRPEGDN